jgi:DNA-binding response OmpR family regulator
MKKILVIEDDSDIRELLEYNLMREGFDVVLCSNGESGLEKALDGSHDLIVLDLMLPIVNGVEICQRVRQNPATAATPVIMLTAKSEETDIVFGLGLGADDYITKPFGIKELVARVYARLRTQAQATPVKTKPATGILKEGCIEIDRDQHQVTVAGEGIAMTLAEFRIFEALMSRPGMVLSRDQLLEAVSGGGGLLVDRNIDVHIRSIRKKLGNSRDLIETVRGMGYRLKKSHDLKASS